jgi:hypothetical protein
MPTEEEIMVAASGAASASLESLLRDYKALKYALRDCYYWVHSEDRPWLEASTQRTVAGLLELDDQ